MALPDLTGINIENSYQRVVHTDGVNYYNGTGSLLNLGPINTGSFATTGSNRFNGNQTITGSLSQGLGSRAIGIGSHAEGYFTTASEAYSHAEGFQSAASGLSSHAEGFYTKAIGEYSHAEGNSTQAIGNQSHAEGAGSKTGVTTAYYVENIVDGVLLLRGASYGDKTTEFLPGTTIIYDDFEFDGAYNRTTFIVLSSIYDGTNTIVTLTDNTVQGSAAIIGNADAIISWTGDQTLRGDYAHVEGTSTIALGNFSHAEGNSTLAVGETSHVEGSNNKAIGSYSHAEGISNRATGNASHAEGDSTQTLGYASHTQGVSTNTGQYGYYTPDILNGIIVLPSVYGDVTSQFTVGGYVLLDDYDYDDNYTVDRFEISSTNFAAGVTKIFLVDTTVSTTEAIIGVYDLFQPTGADKVLGGYGSHAEGSGTNAIGPYSHAEGVSAQAIGQGSHAEGRRTLALGDFQHVQGQYNIASSAQSAFIVGNGTSNASKSNLIYAAGNSVQITGSLSVSGSVIINNVDIQSTIVAMAIALG
jgi:hypothetical protein